MTAVEARTGRNWSYTNSDISLLRRLRYRFIRQAGSQEASHTAAHRSPVLPSGLPSSASMGWPLCSCEPSWPAEKRREVGLGGADRSSGYKAPGNHRRSRIGVKRDMNNAVIST